MTPSLMVGFAVEGPAILRYSSQAYMGPCLLQGDSFSLRNVASMASAGTGNRAAATTGLVLAGGRSRRMGRDKGLLPLGELPLLSRVVRRVAAACDPVIVVARHASDYPDCEVRVIGDRWPDAGPLGGLITGLQASETSCAAAVACDLPFVEPAVLAGLIERAPGWDAVVPVVAGRPQTLCAVYSRGIAEIAERILHDGGRSLRELIAAPDLRVRYVEEDDLRAWDPPLQSFININTPGEYERARVLLEGGQKT